MGESLLARQHKGDLTMNDQMFKEAVLDISSKLNQIIILLEDNIEAIKDLKDHKETMKITEELRQQLIKDGLLKDE